MGRPLIRSNISAPEVGWIGTVTVARAASLARQDSIKSRLRSEAPVARVRSVSRMPRVLLVEDDDAIRTVLARGLRGLGHVVTPVATGAAAIAALASEPPDVVVLDL